MGGMLPSVLQRFHEIQEGRFGYLVEVANGDGRKGVVPHHIVG